MPHLAAWAPKGHEGRSKRQGLAAHRAAKTLVNTKDRSKPQCNFCVLQNLHAPRPYLDPTCTRAKWTLFKEMSVFANINISSVFCNKKIWVQHHMIVVGVVWLLCDTLHRELGLGISGWKGYRWMEHLFNSCSEMDNLEWDFNIQGWGKVQNKKIEKKTNKC